MRCDSCSVTGVRDEITAVFQPIVSLSTGVVAGYEALARFASGLPPDVALQAARRTRAGGVPAELACLRAALAAGAPPDGARLWINIGAQALSSTGFTAILPELPPGSVLELTEHQSVTDYAALRRQRALLRDADLFLAVDDVGAGYSSLAHVLQLQPDFLKIDRELVAGVHEDATRRSIVHALTTFARSAGALTVAEGVEAVGELAAVGELGVDLVQGYLIGRPGPAWPTSSAAIRAEGGLRLQWALESVAGSQTLPGMVSVICDHLAREFALVPSVYLVRGDVLRRIGGRGQWQVLDGMPSGVGITGRAYVTGKEVLVHDVAADPHYLEALPGVVAEMCVPVLVGGAAVGVLNVDATDRIPASARTAVRRLAAALGRRLEETGAHQAGESALHRLGRSAAALAGTSTRADLFAGIVRCAADVSGLEDAALWVRIDTTWQLAASTGGPLRRPLGELADDDLADVERRVAGVASCYTTGHRDDPAFPQALQLRAQGVAALVVVPLRAADGLHGLMMVAHSHPKPITADLVEALELLAAHAATCLNRLDAVRQLRWQARRDHLTGALNRAAFDEELRRRFRRRSRPETTSLLLLADVDGFKDVNDRFGHVEGDHVLVSLVAALRGALRPGDLLFRLGGDEFAVLVAVAGPTGVADVAVRLAEAARPVLDAVGAALSLGGTVLAPADPADGPDAAVRRADAELYRRKAAPGYRRSATPRARAGR